MGKRSEGGKKGKGKAQLAIEDGKMDDAGNEESEEEEEETEEEKWKVLLSKARDQANSAKEDCEAAVQKVDLAKRSFKQAMLEEMARKVVALKGPLAKEKAMSLEKGRAWCLKSCRR